MFESIISVENILASWQEFLRGKRNKYDVQVFSLSLMGNIFALHRDLKEKRYIHGPYRAFRVSDPKSRDIHKALVRDRLLHHAMYRILYPFFDKKFIFDSFSCRKEKGTHKALERFDCFIRKESRNNTRQCWALKCDIRKFFANIDHITLLSILEKYIKDKNVLWLCGQVIKSFNSSGEEYCGLPLGNLTSQLFANVYMNEFDQYIKHELGIKYYIRYADDFVICSHDRGVLEILIPAINTFLQERLYLSMHKDKVFIKTIGSGIDFLGWVHFPDHRVLRTATRRRMERKLSESENQMVYNSYLGLLRWGNTKKIAVKIERFNPDFRNGNFDFMR